MFISSIINVVGQILRTKRNIAASTRSVRALVGGSGYFDAAWYVLRNPDVKAAGMDPLEHFCLYGDREFRSPGPLFDSAGYAEAWDDVKASGIGALQHFLTVGRSLGREVSLVSRNPKELAFQRLVKDIAASGYFDEAWYLTANPDVKAAQMDALEHFCRYGDREFRVPGPYFDSASYVATWPDVKASGLGALQHFLSVGRTLGRDAPPLPRRSRAKLLEERTQHLPRFASWIERENAFMRTEIQTLQREADELELKYYTLKATFDRSVREADRLRKQYAHDSRR